MKHHIHRIDTILTAHIRSWGKRYLAVWMRIAGQGMYLFLPGWIFFSWQGWMLWWKPLLPLLLSYITVLLTQAVIQRPRPDYHAISGYKMWFTTYSFPSGHATESAVIALALMLAPAFPSWEMGVLWAAFHAILAGLIMWSRVVVGVHYASDVLAGMLLGAAYAGAFFL